MAKDFAVCQSGKISPNLVTLFKILLTVSSKKFETTILFSLFGYFCLFLITLPNTGKISISKT